MPPLKNSKQERFCQAIFKGMNGEKAAIDAGYEPTNARSYASTLQTYSNIRQRISELQGKVENKNIANVAERKEVLTEILRGRMVHFGTTDEDGEFRPDVNEDNANSAALREVTTKRIVSGKGKDTEIYAVTKVKLQSIVPAVAELNKMEGEYAPQKHEITGDLNLHFEEQDKEL